MKKKQLILSNNIVLSRCFIAGKMQTFPGQVNTATSATAQSSTVSIRFDPSYVRTLPGMLKVAEMVSALLSPVGRYSDYERMCLCWCDGGGGQRRNEITAGDRIEVLILWDLVLNLLGEGRELGGW